MASSTESDLYVDTPPKCECRKLHRIAFAIDEDDTATDGTFDVHLASTVGPALVALESTGLDRSESDSSARESHHIYIPSGEVYVPSSKDASVKPKQWQTYSDTSVPYPNRNHSILRDNTPGKVATRGKGKTPTRNDNATLRKTYTPGKASTHGKTPTRGKAPTPGKAAPTYMNLLDGIRLDSSSTSNLCYGQPGWFQSLVPREVKHTNDVHFAYCPLAGQSDLVSEDSESSMYASPSDYEDCLKRFYHAAMELHQHRGDGRVDKSVKINLTPGHAMSRQLSVAFELGPTLEADQKESSEESSKVLTDQDESSSKSKSSREDSPSSSNESAWKPAKLEITKRQDTLEKFSEFFGVE